MADKIVNRVITVNHQTYGSVNELPPDLRKIYDDALGGATPAATRPKTGLHMSVSITGHEAPGHDDPRGYGAAGPSDDPASLEGRIRDIPVMLAGVVVIGLLLWALLLR